MKIKTLIQIAGSLLLISLQWGCALTQHAPISNSPAVTGAPIQPSLVSSLSSPTDANTQPVIAPAAGQSIRVYALHRGILIGSAVDYDPLVQDKRYSQTLASEFSVLTPENAMKFAVIHPGQNTYDFSQANAIVGFAKQQGKQVRGHTLVWHNQLPQWLTNGNFTRDEMMGILKGHILTVVGHYRGQVSVWDVVNEAVNDNGSLRDSIWLKSIGPDYIDMAFIWAHEADPQAQLFYNDFGNEDLGTKSNAIYALVKGMLKRGVPINGVGFQMHLMLGSTPRPQDVVANMKRLSDLGLNVHITEMDVRIQGTPNNNSLVAQAGTYRNMLQSCLSAGNCKAFVMWGFTDRYSWISQAFPGYGAALIFDGSYGTKPAYNALLDDLKGP